MLKFFDNWNTWACIHNNLSIVIDQRLAKWLAENSTLFVFVIDIICSEHISNEIDLCRISHRCHITFHSSHEPKLIGLNRNWNNIQHQRVAECVTPSHSNRIAQILCDTFITFYKWGIRNSRIQYSNDCFLESNSKRHSCIESCESFI